MKLTPDCMRDVMFYLEEHLTVSESLEFVGISLKKLEANLDYPIQEIANTLIVLKEAGFIEAFIDHGSDRIAILDVYRITYSGYQFIESIRPDPVWSKVKDAGKHIGSLSVSMVTQVASSVLTTMVNAYLSGQLSP